MGAAIATRLMKSGHEITVWNRTAAKTRPLADAGAQVAATPAALTRSSEIIISMLTDAASVNETYSGTDGLLAGEAAGRLFVEMSTVRPQVVRALAVKVREQGGALIDCPVGGTVGPALEGRLLGFVGGESADVARARPVLEQLCRRVEHVGGAGAGASMKLAINLPLLVYWQVVGEALSLCAPLKLDPQRMLDILGDTSGAPSVLKVRGPALAQALQGETPGGVTFDIDMLRKDLRTMIEEAQSLGAALPVTARALECFDESSRRGLGAQDAVTHPAAWVKNNNKNK